VTEECSGVLQRPEVQCKKFYVKAMSLFINLFSLERHWMTLQVLIAQLEQLVFLVVKEAIWRNVGNVAKLAHYDVVHGVSEGRLLLSKVVNADNLRVHLRKVEF